MRRFEYKVEAGAEFAVTVPIFDVERSNAFLARHGITQSAGHRAIHPFESLLHAEYLANEVPNLHVPPHWSSGCGRPMPRAGPRSRAWRLHGN